VEGALARREEVGVIAVEREATATILQWKPGARNHDMRAKPCKGGLDKAHHHPVSVRRTQICGITAQRIARLSQQSLPSDQRAAPCGIRLREQLVDRDTCICWVGDKVVYVSERQLHRLEL